MATELARRIRGTRNTLGQEVKKAWIKARNSWCEPLTFGDLSVEDKFIVMPMPGDNSGHDGFLNGSYLFQKIRTCSANNLNSVRLIDNMSFRMLDSMWVLKIL